MNEMRFERHGGPPDLQAAFKRLVLRQLHGRSLDDDQDAEAAAGQFPDFGCFRDLLLIEMKHLETEQEERVNEVMRQKIDPAEAPVFYGRREARLVLDAVGNGREIQSAVAGKLSRTIDRLLSKANQQFVDYRQRHPRKNRVNLCVILNARLREFTPDMVVRAIHSKMKVGQGGPPRFPEIDGILYITEKHFRQLPDGRPALAIATYEAKGAIDHPWKAEVIDRVADAWSRSRTGGPAVSDGKLSGFGTVADIPPSMSRSDAWELEYERNPYLSGLCFEELRFRFHRITALTSLTFLKGSWPKPPMNETADHLRQFQHLIAETNRRGVDMRAFDRALLSTDDSDAVCLGLPEQLKGILFAAESEGADDES